MKTDHSVLNIPTPIQQFHILKRFLSHLNTQCNFLSADAADDNLDLRYALETRFTSIKDIFTLVLHSTHISEQKKSCWPIRLN